MAYKLFRTFRIRDCVKHTYRYELFVRGLYGEDPGDMSDNSTSDGQETVNCLRCNKPPSMFGGRLDKLHGKPREVLANWVSMSEEHLQNLLDAQLSNTGALFGIIVDTDESSGGAEGKGTMENAKAAIKAVSSIDDGAVNNFQVGPPQPDSRSTKVLDMLEWQPIKPPPSSSDLRKKTTHGTSSTNVNVLKILRDQRQMILTAEEKPASSDHHGPNRGQKGSQPSSTKASLCRCGNAHIDLTDDNDSANYTPGKKKAQTATAKAANTHPIPSPSQKAPQTNTSIADPSPQIENTNGFTIEALNDIEDDADDELQIIGEASIRRRRTLRTRTRTVLTYRSRSLSEAVVHPKN